MTEKMITEKEMGLRLRRMDNTQRRTLDIQRVGKIGVRKEKEMNYYTPRTFEGISMCACTLPYEKCCGRQELEVGKITLYPSQNEELLEEIRKLRKLLKRALGKNG